RDLDSQAQPILAQILAAEVLVVGSPTYKGSYTGLFKHFFDLIDPAALRGKPVLLTATGGGDRHALIVEHQLRPLFGFFEAFALVAVLTALLMALSLAVARHGYPYGAIGVRRLDGIADAGTFIPLAAVFFFSALLMMILPIRAASIVLTHAADAIFWTVIVL